MSGVATMVNSAIARFAVDEAGSLVVGGVALQRLAERVGSTPFYAYDRRLITERIAELRRHLPDRVALSYAVKANPMDAVVNHLAALVDGFDVASAREMRIALDAGIDPAAVSFAGPGKRDEELAQAIAAGITIAIESEGEMRRLAVIAKRMETDRVRPSGPEGGPRVVVRVNPDFPVKGSGMRMGGGSGQFGVDAERVPALLAALGGTGLDFAGFHVFAGSQILDAEVVSTLQEQTIDLVKRLAPHAPGPVKHVNIGGGFGIPYFPKDEPLDLAAVGARLGEALTGRAGRELAGARIVVELGRYIVGEAGVYVTRIIDRKESRGQVYLVTDGGLHHHLAASGNFGQVIRRNYPVAIGNRMSARARETASIVGCLCTPLDLLADRVELPVAEVGDLVVVFQSGAYGRTASPVDFLGHPAPVEVLV